MSRNIECWYVKPNSGASYRTVEIFSKGGGYVFNTIHNILPDVPPQNIITMFDAVKEFNSK
jgi:uroporphyrinogen-III decarboxylase